MLWKSCFSVIISNMTPIPQKLKKKTYFLDFVKQIFLPETLFANKCPQARDLYMKNPHKKTQAILVNFVGISDIGLKGRPESEKNKGKGNSFHDHFPNDFSISCIFPI